MSLTAGATSPRSVDSSESALDAFHAYVGVRPPRFANPSERFCAEIFDALDVPWDLRSKTFVLERHADGHASESFTPDFYLPTHDLYIEITTMKQSLVTRKNRLVRKLRAVRPDANIKLFYRRDITALPELIPATLDLPSSMRPRVETVTGLVDREGRPLRVDSETTWMLAENVKSVYRALTAHLAWRPDHFHRLSDDQFEEVITDLLMQGGYTAELTIAGPDGGVDIFASRDDDLGPFLYAIQCKRNRPSNRVGASVVREFYGAVSATRATAGILVTTSYFTRSAQELEATYANRIRLTDYDGLVRWVTAASR
jgi:Restriction endonuclease